MVREVFGIHKGLNGPDAFRMDVKQKAGNQRCTFRNGKLAQSTDQLIAAVKETVAANQIGRGLIKILAYWGREVIIFSWSWPGPAE